jgi:hypothetical protein
MNNTNDLQFTITLVVLVVVLALSLSPVIALFAYIFFQNSKRRKIRDRIISSRFEVIGDKRWFPIRYASQPRFDAWFKVFPWEGAGIMLVTSGSVLFLGETMSGAQLTLQFAPANSRISWLGKCPWPNGAVSWLSFETAAEKHYFSSETGILVLGSHNSTKALYDEANRYFGSPAAQNL